MTLNEPIILASSSPRRQKILKFLHIPYQIIIPNIDETIDNKLDIQDVPKSLALKKLEEVKKSSKNIKLILAADTVIIFNNKIYGKPNSQDDAISFMKKFSGRKHFVKTAIALYNSETKTTTTRECTTEVIFKKLSENEINWYIDTGEWHGVAGGYRIQGLASCFIKRINGSMSAVEGLPIFELYDMLQAQGYSMY